MAQIKKIFTLKCFFLVSPNCSTPPTSPTAPPPAHFENHYVGKNLVIWTAWSGTGHWNDIYLYIVFAIITIEASLTCSQSILRKNVCDLISVKPVWTWQPSRSLGSWWGQNSRSSSGTERQQKQQCLYTVKQYNSTDLTALCGQWSGPGRWHCHTVLYLSRNNPNPNPSPYVLFCT